MVSVIRQYMTSNKMLASVQARVNRYLEVQWSTNGGYTIRKERSILYDAPTSLFEEQQIAKYHAALIRVPLFQVKIIFLSALFLILIHRGWMLSA